MGRETNTPKVHVCPGRWLLDIPAARRACSVFVRWKEVRRHHGSLSVGDPMLRGSGDGALRVRPFARLPRERRANDVHH